MSDDLNVPIFISFCIALLMGIGTITFYRIIYLRLNMISLNMIQLLFFIALITYIVVTIVRLRSWMITYGQDRNEIEKNVSAILQYWMFQMFFILQIFEWVVYAHFLQF